MRMRPDLPFAIQSVDMQLHSQTVLKQAQQYWDVKHWSWIELNKHYCIQVDSYWSPSTSMVVHRQ